MSKMYEGSVQQINPLKGCRFSCTYCAFRKLMSRGMSRCKDCTSFTPHWHDNVLTKPPKKTTGNQFVSMCLNGDVSNANPDEWKLIMDYINKYSDVTFFIQSKDPSCFWEHCPFPSNVILCTTLESNRFEGYNLISKAPIPIIRCQTFIDTKHPRKAITIEPIMDFDEVTLLQWIYTIDDSCGDNNRIEFIHIGYDSRNHHLSEPTLEKTQHLINTLKELGYNVIPKLLRKAWYEQ